MTRNIADNQKCHKLKSSLTGEAKELVSSLTVTSSNYTIAWRRLIERYDNKRLIAACHIRHVLELKQMNRESVNELAELTPCQTTPTTRSFEDLWPVE
jgi:hypothetical protein